MTTEVLFFFREHMDALPLYEKLETELLARIPDVRIKVSKTQISFSNKRGFACVSFNPCRKANIRPKTWLTISFGLGYQKLSDRIDAVVEPYPGRWTHHLMIGSCAEIDDALMDWIAEAAAFSANKK